MKNNVAKYINEWLLEEEKRITNNIFVSISLANITLIIPPGIFLPSPEITHSTPLLLKSIQGLNFYNKRILDLGTGSGFFAIYSSLKGAISVVATDTKENILSQASHNATINNANNIEFIKSNVFDNIKGECDYIFANGPISTEAWPKYKTDGHSIESYGGALLSQYRKHLKPDGLMFMTFAEFGPVGEFYKTLKKNRVKYSEHREEKFGIWWGFYQIYR
ncbi:TPA: methyltransferase [Enterobacter bugandensis]|nr:methyltransferase [Enterobacter bugandensis]